MNDHIADEDLAAYVDGALRGAPKAELESHLSRCPECLAALAEVVDIQGSAVKIPGEFLRQALGERPSPARVVPPMRLVFGIAAVFLVAIVVGYFFIGRERAGTDRVSEKEMPRQAVAAGERQPPARTAGPARRETAERTVPVHEDRAEAAGKLKMEKKFTAGEPGSSRPAAQSLNEAFVPAIQPAKEEKMKRAADADLAQPEGVEAGAVGGVLGRIEAPAEKDKENAIVPAAAPALPEARAEELRQNDEKISRKAIASGLAKGAAADGLAQSRSRSSGEFADGAMQLLLAATGHSATPWVIRIHPLVRRSPIRIEGDVSWADLRDPGLLHGWRWFKKGMVLELEIAADGTVRAVNPVGRWDPQAAAQADDAARELLFSVSEKRVRRAILDIPEAPPN